MKKLFLAAAVSTALMATPALAQGYLGVGIGEANTNTNENSWKLFGGYQFTPMWGVELGYTDLGSYRGSDIESWYLAATGTLPLSDRWSLIGKLGGASNRSKFQNASNHSDLLAGVGVAYAINKNLDVRLEYEDHGKLSEGIAGGDSSGNNLSLSLKFGF